MIGDSGLTDALYRVGYTMNDVNPDFVIVGETRAYRYELVEKAVNLVRLGARCAAAGPDSVCLLGGWSNALGAWSQECTSVALLTVPGEVGLGGAVDTSWVQSFAPPFMPLPVNTK